MDRSGFVRLQVHGIAGGQGPYQVRWRGVRILELKPSDRGDAPPAPEGFRSVFHGPLGAFGITLVAPAPRHDDDEIAAREGEYVAGAAAACIEGLVAG